MKILQVISLPIPPEDGIGNYAWRLSDELRSLGFESEILTRGGLRAPRYETVAGIKVHRPPSPSIYPFHVHAHAFFTRRYLERAGREFDLFHVHTPLPPPITTRKRQLLTVHTLAAGEAARIHTRDVHSFLQRWQSRISGRIERQLVRDASLITTVSNSIASEITLYHPTAPTPVVTGNAVDHKRFVPGLHEREDFVLYLGRIGPRKGVDILIKAWQILFSRGVRYNLVIAGTGPYEDSIRRLAHQAGVSRHVEFRGYVSDSDRLELLQRARAVVLPSLYEGLPTTALEAMATAAPLVATDAPGTVDLVRSGVNGLLATAGSAESLAASLELVLRDSSLCRKVGEAARRDVEAHYTWEALAKRYASLYCSD